MRVIFAGTPANAAYTLEALVAAGIDVVGALTRKDAPIGRARVITESAVAVAAKTHGIETLKANTISDEAERWMAELRPDLGVIVAYGSILKKSVLDAPALGWINLHFSLLPKFPGAAPVQHALLGGDTATGVTIFRLDEGIDTGPILAQAQVKIAEDSTSGELLQELAVVGTKLLIDTLEHLEERLANQQLQSTPTGAQIAGKISRNEAQIDFLRPAQDVHNLVRALNPEPVAWFEFQGSPVRVIKTSPLVLPEIGAGEGLMVDGDLVMGCGQGAVRLVSVQPAGKNQMSGADWFRGLRRDSILVL